MKCGSVNIKAVCPALHACAGCDMQKYGEIYISVCVLDGFSIISHHTKE